MATLNSNEWQLEIEIEGALQAEVDIVETAKTTK
jgi:hypothetical protein